MVDVAIDNATKHCGVTIAGCGVLSATAANLVYAITPRNHAKAHSLAGDAAEVVPNVDTAVGINARNLGIGLNSRTITACVDGTTTARDINIGSPYNREITTVAYAAS